MTLDDYLDAALARAGLASDRQFCKHLGLSPSTTSWWRTKRAWPRDDVMVRIAEMAGQDPEQALIDLNEWRSEGKAKLVYQRIAQKIAGTAAAIAICVGAAGHIYPTDAQANPGLTRAADNLNSLYYGKYW